MKRVICPIEEATALVFPSTKHSFEHVKSKKELNFEDIHFRKSIPIKWVEDDVEDVEQV